MTNQHPITPPPELVQQWWEEADQYQDDPETYFDHVATQAAQWGADQELEACCQALYSRYVNTGLLPATAATVSQEMRDWLRTTRRSKPPSLKEQALAELAATERCHPADYSTIRKALEALPND